MSSSVKMCNNFKLLLLVIAALFLGLIENVMPQGKFVFDDLCLIWFDNTITMCKNNKNVFCFRV